MMHYSTVEFLTIIMTLGNIGAPEPFFPKTDDVFNFFLYFFFHFFFSFRFYCTYYSVPLK